jgi:hypothetical protein
MIMSRNTIIVLICDRQKLLNKRNDEKEEESKDEAYGED